MVGSRRLRQCVHRTRCFLRIDVHYTAFYGTLIDNLTDKGKSRRNFSCCRDWTYWYNVACGLSTSGQARSCMWMCLGDAQEADQRLHPDPAAAIADNVSSEVCICFTSHTACDCAAEVPKVHSTRISSALKGQSLRLCMTAEHVSAACPSLLHACPRCLATWFQLSTDRRRRSLLCMSPSCAGERSHTRAARAWAAHQNPEPASPSRWCKTPRAQPPGRRPRPAARRAGPAAPARNISVSVSTRLMVDARATRSWLARLAQYAAVMLSRQ